MGFRRWLVTSLLGAKRKVKPEPLRALLTARVLFDRAQDSCASFDRHAASAGIVLLQDALELVFYSVLVECGVDQQKAIDNLDFPKLIAEVKKTGNSVPKSGTLKALNHTRLTIKHYGQLADPATVRTYLSSASLAIETLLKQVFGKGLQEILLTELIAEGESKECLDAAGKALENGKYYDALVEIRKALYLEIEIDYMIEGWKDHDPATTTPRAWAMVGLSGGRKAPYYTKNREWIDRNVRSPFDYIQRDHEHLRSDLMEWGVSTQEFWNLFRLTPSVVRLLGQSTWLVQDTPTHMTEGATKENARYCLDRAVSLIAKKQAHFDLARQLNRVESLYEIELTADQDLYEKASASSSVVAGLKKGERFRFSSLCDGFDGNKYVYVFHMEGLMSDRPARIGYLPVSSCKVVAASSTDTDQGA